MAKDSWKTDVHSSCRDMAELTPEMQTLVATFLSILATISIPVMILETYRRQERQDILYKEGSSKIKISVHTKRNAIDIVPIDKDGKPLWNTPKETFRIMAEIWKALNPKNIAGHFWTTFVDSVHFQYGD